MAHDGQRQAPVLLVEECEEAGQIGRVVGASDDLEEIGRKFFRPAGEALQGWQRRRAPKVVDRNDARNVSSRGFLEHGTKLRAGPEFNVDESSQRKEMAKQFAAVISRQIVATPFARMPRGDDERSG